MRRVSVLAVAALGLIAAGEAPIAFPEGFRTWTHISSAVLGPENSAAPKYEGVHYIYANPKAMEGYRTGKWPDGAVIVYDQWTAEVAGKARTSRSRQGPGEGADRRQGGEQRRIASGEARRLRLAGAQARGRLRR